MNDVIKNVPKLRFADFSGEWLKSKTAIKIVAGNAYPMSFYGESGSMLVQGQNIFPNELKVESPVFIPESELSERDVQIKQNDILLGLNRPIIGKRLKACLYRDNRKAVLYQRAGKLVFDESKLHSGFLFQYLFSGIFTKQLLGELVGSDQPYIKSDLFKVTKNYFPDIQEQQKIADFLSSVDKKIEQLTEKYRLLTEYKKGIMQQIFTQQIRFKDNQGNDYPEWEEKRLGDICIKKSSTIAANAIEDSKGIFKMYGASGELKSVDFYDEESPYVAIVKDGAGVGRVQYCEAKSSVLGTLDKIFPVNGVQLTFLYEVLKGINFEKYTTGSTIPHIYFKDYKKELVGLPTGEEQQKIANFLTKIDQKIDQTWSTLDKTKAFKKGLLQKMFVWREIAWYKWIYQKKCEKRL